MTSDHRRNGDGESDHDGGGGDVWDNPVATIVAIMMMRMAVVTVALVRLLPRPIRRQKRLHFVSRVAPGSSRCFILTCCLMFPHPKS